MENPEPTGNDVRAMPDRTLGTDGGGLRPRPAPSQSAGIRLHQAGEGPKFGGAPALRQLGPVAPNSP